MIPFATALIGCWLIATAFSFHKEADFLFYSDLVTGCILVGIGLFLRPFKGAWKGWLIGLIGLWLSAAPLLFWAKNPAVYLNNTLSGMLALAIFLYLPIVNTYVPNEGPSIPPGWSFNPSSWAQRIPIIFLAFVCWMISRYLAAYQLGYIDTVWDPFFPNGTHNVLTSDVSKAFPVSDAGLGALAYTIETLSGFGNERRWRTSPWLVLLFGVLTIPVAIVSVILIMLQPILVGAWCSLCIFNAFLMLVPIAISIDEVAASIQFLRYSKEKPFWKLLWEGGNCPEASPDHRTPELDRPLHKLLKASLWGITLPWNLCATFFLGASIMVLPSFFETPKWIADLNHVFGALTIVTVMVAFSELARKARYLNLLFVAPLILSPLFAPFSPFTAVQIAIALSIAFLSLREGPKKERCLYFKACTKHN